MGNKYTKDEIKNILQENGYIVIGEIINLGTKVLCETKEGYRVMVTPSALKNRGDTPKIFSVYNPYTIYNINLWIKNNNLTCKLLSDTYKNSKEKLKWECECGEPYFASWNDVSSDNKRYCNHCAKSKRYDDLVDYNELVQKECEKRDYILLPNQNISRGNTEFKYICKKHFDKGEQVNIPYNFVTDYGIGGCYWCGVEKRSLSKRKDEEYFKDIVESVGLIYVGVCYSDDDRTRLIYKCKEHLDKGNFSTYITNMKNNKGNCPCCNGQFRTKEDLQSELDDLNIYVKILEYEDYSSPILCKCKICKHIWETSGVNLTQGHACPKCTISKFELSVQNILDELKLLYVSQYRFDDCRDINPLPFDFYLNEYNVAIEVDGEGHYYPIKYSSSWTEKETLANFYTIKKHDKIKTKYCINNNIELIRIPYYERNNLKSFLTNKLIEKGVL